MKTQNRMKRMFVIALALFAMLATASADWTTYDGSILPGDAGWNVKNGAGAEAAISLVDDADNAGNKILQFISGASDKNTLEAPKFDSKVSGGGTKQAFTVVMRARALRITADSAYANFMEVEVKDGEIRDKARFYPTKGLDIEKANGKELKPYPAGHDSYDFNIYRVTFKEGVTKIWVNDVLVDESVAGSTTSSDSDSRFVIGDSNSSADYGIQYDWVIYDNTDAYAPGEGADYPSSIILSPLDGGSGEDNWTIYDASEDPETYGFSASSSNTSGWGETATPIDDVDNAGNKVLDFSTIDSLQSKLSFSKSLSIDSTKGFTVIMRAKGKSLDHDLIEVTLKSGVSYEKIRFYTDKGELNVEKGTEETQKVSYSVPEGVDMTDWNVYRFSIVDSVLNMWVNEIQVGFNIKTTRSLTTSTNFGFGEGNSGMTYASYIDWIIFDETGAYGPTEGSDLPSSLIISPLTGGEVVIPDFLRFDDANVNIGSAAQTISDLGLEANTSWVIGTTDSWITSVTPLQGDSGVATFSVTVEENVGAAPRIGSIYALVEGELMDQVTITQEGQAVLIESLGAVASSAQLKDGVLKDAPFAIDRFDSTAWVPAEGIVNGQFETIEVTLPTASEVVLVKIMEYKNNARRTAFSVDYWNGTAYVESLPLQYSPLQTSANSEVAYSLPSAVTTDKILFKFYGSDDKTTGDDPLDAAGWLTISEVSAWGAAPASALNEIGGVAFNVYPNPTSGSFTIENASGANVQLISLAGRLVLERTNISSKEQISLDAPSGMYLLKVGDAVSKIVIE